MIGIIDYGLGNVKAFANIYKRLGLSFCVINSALDFKKVSKIILPGVGAFDWAMTSLQRSGLREALDDQVLGAQKPVLGVCVGMQIMAATSDEGALSGLNWIDAKITKFDCNVFTGNYPVPHMGWNNAIYLNSEALFNGIDSPAFYFLHSYYMEPRNRKNILAVSDYGLKFASAVRNKNVYGVQFHPEKSHECGVRLLKNFAEIA